MRSYLMEFIGTCFLVLAVGLTGNPLAIGVMLAVMITAGGHISGGHFNPAVTLAVFLRGKLPSKEVMPYMISQIAGAFVAAFIIFLLTDKTFGVAPAAGFDAWKAILAELIFTFALCFVVLNVATAKKMEGNFVYGFAIGLTVLTSAFCVGSLSGGAFNPAVAIGPAIMDTLKGGSSMGHLYIYMVGCFGGGVLAAYTFKYLNQEA